MLSLSIAPEKPIDICWPSSDQTAVPANLRVIAKSAKMQLFISYIIAMLLAFTSAVPIPSSTFQEIEKRWHSGESEVSRPVVAAEPTLNI